MNRDTALSAIRENVKNENLIAHMMATEAVIRALARRFGEDEEVWGAGRTAARYRCGIDRRAYTGSQQDGGGVGFDIDDEMNLIAEEGIVIALMSPLGI